MISYKSIVINFYKFFISTYLFFFISIQSPIGGITIDRFLTLILFILIVVAFKHRYNLFVSTIFILLIYIAFSKIIYVYELFPKYFVSLICLLVLYISYRVGKLNYDFYNYFVFTFLIIVAISIYSISSFLSSGIVPSEFSFLESIPFIRPVVYEHMATVNLSYLFPRLSLPYPTPPQLSIVLALYSLYFLQRVIFYKSRLSKILFLSSILLIFATVSRSGIIPCILICFIYFNITSKSNFLKKYFLVFVFTSILVVLLSIISTDLTQVIYERFFFNSLESFTAGHSSARFIAIELYSQGSIFELLFGNGIGNYPDNHAHMTLLTFLYEIGLIGVSIFSFLFIQRIIVCYKFYKKFPNNSKNHLFELMLLLLIFFGMALYEFTYVIPIYIFLGLAVGNSFYENKIIQKHD